MAAYLSPIGNAVTFFTAQGVVLQSGKIYTYIAGTTTPQSTFTDSTQATPNPNPIILGTNGIPPNEIWLTSGLTYKFVFTDSNGNVLSTYDNISGVNDINSNPSEWKSTGVTPTYVSATTFTVSGNLTSTFPVNQRVQCFVSAGTVYGYVSSSSYGAGVTTVVVVLDSGSLDSGLTSVKVALLSSTNVSVPQQFTNFTQSGTGAVARLIQSKLKDHVNIKDFGCVCDGITDDSANFLLARTYAQANGRTLHIYGTPLISVKQTISTREHWVFQGGLGITGAASGGPYSYIIKASSLHDDCIVVSSTAKGTVIEYGGIEGQAGNTGNGITVLGHSFRGKDITVIGMGGDGFRFGSDSPGANANGWRIEGCYSASNNGIGFKFSDNPTGLSSNVNAGVGVNCYAVSNGSHGLYAQNCGSNVMDGFHAESNTGWGVYLDGYTEQFSFIGGDSENNTAGDVFVASARKSVTGTANNGSGLIRLTLDSTTYLTTGDTAVVSGVGGTTEANGTWVITVIDSTHIDLQSSTYTNAYTSGGVVNNYAGSHKIGITYGGTYTDNGWMTSNFAMKGNGGSARPINASGTWTVSLIGSSTAGTPTYNTRQGEWALNGNMCTAWFDVRITSTTGMAGSLYISGLPFPFATNRGCGSIEFIDFVTYPAGTTYPSLSSNGSGTSTLAVIFSGSGIASALLPIASVNSGGNTRIRGVITYQCTTT